MKKGEPICIINILIKNIDAYDPHSGPITQMYYEENTRILITASKDKTIKVYLDNLNILLDMETTWKMGFRRCWKVWRNWDKNSEGYCCDVENSKTVE